VAGVGVGEGVKKDINFKANMLYEECLSSYVNGKEA
jgi:hypothetical protein